MIIFFLCIQLFNLDSLYITGQYHEYIEQTKYSLKSDSSYSITSDDYFKLAIANYHTKNYAVATSLFSTAEKKNHPLVDFARYYRIRMLLDVQHPNAIDSLNTFINTHPEFPLTPFLIIEKQPIIPFEKHISLIEFLKKKLKRAPYLEFVSGILADSLSSKTLKKTLYFSALKKYSGQRKLAPFLYSFSKDSLTNSELTLLFKEAILQKDKSSLNHLYLSYSRIAQMDSLKEVKLSYYFLNKKYSSIIKEIKTLPYFSKEVSRIVPRTYKALGSRKKMLNAYLNYALQFPNDAFAQNASTYVLDKTQTFKKRKQIYQQLQEKGGRFLEFYQFREILDYYQNAQFKTALKKCKTYYSLSSKRWYQDKLKFWEAKILYETGKKTIAISIFKQLAEDPLRNYHSAKSFIFLQENKIPFSLPDSVSNQNEYELKPTYLVKRLKKVHQLLGDSTLAKVIDRLNIWKIKSTKELLTLHHYYNEIQLYKHAIRVAYRIAQKNGFNRSFYQKHEDNKYVFPKYYTDLIQHNAKVFSVEEELIRALIYRESTYDRYAESVSNAHGLMQLIPETAYLMSRKTKIPYTDINDLYNPEINIPLGTAFLKSLLKRFNGKYEYVLAAYNAGPSRVKRWKKRHSVKNSDLFIETIGFEQTRTYVKKVLFSYYAYKILYSKQADVYYSGISSR